MTNDLKIVSTVDERREKLHTEVADLENQLSEKNNKLEKEKYFIEYAPEDIANLKVFLRTKAKWTAAQALGILESIKILEEAESDAKKHKIKGIMLNNVPIEAMCYFLSKHEDVGMEYVPIYVGMFKPIFKVRERLLELRKEINDLEEKIKPLKYALDNNINVEEEIKTIDDPIEIRTAEEIIQ